MTLIIKLGLKTKTYLDKAMLGACTKANNIVGVGMVSKFFCTETENRFGRIWLELREKYPDMSEEDINDLALDLRNKELIEQEKKASIFSEESEPKTSINSDPIPTIPDSECELIAKSNSKEKEEEEDDVLDLKIERENYLSHLKSFLERIDGEIDSLRLLQDLPDISSRIAFYDYFRMKLIALENIELINKSEKRLIDFDYKVETSFDYTIGTSFDDIENKLETLPEEEKLTYFRDLLISDYLKIKEKYQEVCDLEFTEEKINSSQEESNNDI